MLGSLFLAAGLFLGADAAASDAANLANFSSYRDAWHAAKDEHRPMLVVLNPAEGDAKAEAVKVAELRKDEALGEVLNKYVVAEIDTSTEQGRKVLEVFKSPTLPRIIVIDNQQKNQVFATSAKVTNSRLKSVLETYKDGKTEMVSFDWMPKAKADCPNCRLRMGL